MPDARVLVVEDDPLIRDAVAAALTRHGYQVDTAPDAHTAIHTTSTDTPDLAVIDLGLGAGPDGLAVLDHLRGRGDTPVVILSAADTVEDRLAGLRAGADDYLTKPFSTAELLARVDAVLRRANRRPATRLTAGPLTLDAAARTVTINGEPVALTRTEFNLLEALVRNQGRAVTKRELLDAVWGHRYQPGLIDTHMSSLRRKLGAAAGLIRTVRGVGYLVQP